jgi:hypothetical protein
MIPIGTAWLYPQELLMAFRCDVSENVLVTVVLSSGSGTILVN